MKSTAHVYLLSTMKFALLVPVASIRTSEVFLDKVRSALRIFAVCLYSPTKSANEAWTTFNESTKPTALAITQPTRALPVVFSATFTPTSLPFCSTVIQSPVVT